MELANKIFIHYKNGLQISYWIIRDTNGDIL